MLLPLEATPSSTPTDCQICVFLPRKVGVVLQQTEQFPPLTRSGRRETSVGDRMCKM
jgi:hypothetical protein